MQQDNYKDFYQDTDFWEVDEYDFLYQIEHLGFSKNDASLSLYANGKEVGFIVKDIGGVYSCYELLEEHIEYLTLVTSKRSEVATEVYNWRYSWE